MGIRTPDLLIANETLYQLSYTPAVLAHELRPSRKGYGKRNRRGKRKAGGLCACAGGKARAFYEGAPLFCSAETFPK